MTVGQKIKKLRTEKGLTQKELSEQVYVTFQTVSKWENDENEPDISTLRELAKLFGCSLDYLLSENDEEPVKEEQKEESAPITQTIIIHQKELHVCERCHKDIPEDDLAVEPLTKTVRHGPSSHRVAAGQAYYHKDCLLETIKERNAAAARARAAKAKRAKKFSFGWGIGGGVAALGIALALFLTHTDVVNPGLGVLYSVLIGYGIFAMLYCIISGSYIGDVFVWAAGLSIKFPGLIFTWDLEGFVWLIGMKILFAILGFLIGVLALLFAVVLCGALGAISFPFVLIHNNKIRYGDAITD